MSDNQTPNLPDDQPRVDREQVFQIYATFCGDVVRTSHALNMRPVDVQRMVDEELWKERLAEIIELKNSKNEGDVERACNRAYNYVQAHRMRLIVERVVSRLFHMSAAELEDYLFTEHAVSGRLGDKVIDKNPKLSTRAIADLASAMEKAQVLSYMALNDTTAERLKRRGEEPSAGSAVNLHQQIASAMAKVRATETPRALLFDAQVERAEAEREKATQAPTQEPYKR